MTTANWLQQRLASQPPLPQSALRTMTARCEAVGGVNLAQGLCQIEPAPELLDQADRFRIGSHTYTPPEGDLQLRLSIAQKLKTYNGIDADPSSEIVVTIGASGAFNATLLALFQQGDGVLLPEPFYPYHRLSLLRRGLVPQPVASVDGRLNVDAIEEAIDKTTRAIMLCTPGNPSGKRLSRDELQRIAVLADAHDLLVITDEIYEHIYFGDQPHVSPATIDGLRERTVTISGLSKTFSIPGWRLGYLTAPAQLAQAVKLASETLVACAPTPLQRLGCTALNFDASFYEDLRALYTQKRDRLISVLTSIGLVCDPPEGAYYLMVDCSSTGATSGVQAADLLLERYGIATVPSEEFYCSVPPTPMVRACFSVKDETLAEVEEKLNLFI